MSPSTPAPRRPILAANWKMYKTPAETARFFTELRGLLPAERRADLVVAAPFVCIPAAVEAARGLEIAIAGQNLFWEKEGAFTGEIAAGMLSAAGAHYVVIGHSERRQYFHETDETVNRRLRAALEGGLTPIVCVGETLEERERGETDAVLRRQFEGGFAGLSPADVDRCVVAYEPVWAIGTGRTASPEMAEAAHAGLRQLAAARFGTDVAQRLRILYGGSVKPDNIAALMAQPDIDGGLVGGASLKPESYAALLKF